MKRAALSVGAIIGSLLVMLVVVGFMNLTLFIDADPPSRGDLPELPNGLRISNVTDDMCGSGSCSLSFDVVGPSDATPESILEQLPQERYRCSAHSLIDRRPLCRYYRIRDGVVRGGVSLGKWQGT